MPNQLGSGSISCLRPAVETEHLVQSNERQDHWSVLFSLTYSHRPHVLGHVGAVRVPTGSCFQPLISQQAGAPHTGVWMFEGPTMQHFLID